VDTTPAIIWACFNYTCTVKFRSGRNDLNCVAVAGLKGQGERCPETMTKLPEWELRGFQSSSHSSAVSKLTAVLGDQWA